MSILPTSLTADGTFEQSKNCRVFLPEEATAKEGACGCLEAASKSGTEHPTVHNLNVSRSPELYLILMREGERLLMKALGFRFEILAEIFRIALNLLWSKYVFT